ncbi:hypothetical protein BGX21_000018 [Mortierella sp. AD011]|nr:hypothetical protein BGX21_000018 [Mortierella sp. AD011]
MTTIPRSAQGSYSDLHNHSNHIDHIDHQQYTNLGMQQTGPSEMTPSQQATPQLTTKTLAITSRDTKGAAPPPLMGSAIVLVNDSALHCFGGRLVNRNLTNCHYVLDVETGYWQAIQAAPQLDSDTDAKVNDPRTLLSLSLSTDPVNNTASLSEAISIPPSPRYFHTLNAYGTSIILFGGMGAAQGSMDGNDSDNEGSQRSAQQQLVALNDLHVYDIVTQRWQQKHPPVNEHTPRARWAHMATILDHFLVVIGGTDSAKAYVEDACVLDLSTWEWVASVRNIGQCGSYRTVAAAGPSMQSSSEFTPSSHSFPSAAATTVSTSKVSPCMSWLVSDTDSSDIMASISMILSGRISVPSSTSSSPPESSELKDSRKGDTDKKTSQRLASGDLTPSFKSGKDFPSIYLYSNYNFQSLQREFKVIVPQHTQSSTSPSFGLVDKSQALENLKPNLPPGLRFPQAHVYQNQLVLTGTLIVPGNAPTLAIYALDLATNNWERLETGSMLQKGSWNRTLLHPASGTLLIFGNYESNPEQDYSNRIQHHDHIMMIDLQTYGLYERPVPSFLPSAQELGQDLLSIPGFSDMHIASVSGTLFDANSTILAARWPEFANLLLSPPYVTPLILELPVPDETVPVFLHYLYTGALPGNGSITPAVADHLLILARQYGLNGLHALTLDILHQSVALNPVRVHTCALMAGEIGLQARAVGLAMAAAPSKTATQQAAPSQGPSTLPGQNQMTSPPSSARNPSAQGYVIDSGLSRSYSNRVPPPSNRPSVPPERRRVPSHNSQDSVSTDGGVGESLLQQYNPTMDANGHMVSTMSGNPQDLQQPMYTAPQELGPSVPSRQRKMRSPPMPPNYASPHPVSFISTSSGGSGFENSPAPSPIPPRTPQMYPQQQQQQQHYQQQHHQQYRQQYQQTGYPSPLSPSIQTMSTFSSQGGYLRTGGGSDGAPSVYSYDEQDDSLSSHSGSQGQETRTQQAKRRLQMQMQMQPDVEQRHDIVYHNPAAVSDIYPRGPASNASTRSSAPKNGYATSQITLESKHPTESIAETVTSSKSAGSSSSKATSIKSSSSDKDKKKGVLSKMKPPKPKASAAELMKSAGF